MSKLTEEQREQAQAWFRARVSELFNAEGRPVYGIVWDDAMDRELFRLLKLAEKGAAVEGATEAWQLHGKYGLTIDGLKTGEQVFAFGALPEGWSWSRVLILPAEPA